MPKTIAAFFRLSLPFLLLITALPAQAAALETIPLYHWSYDYIDELILRGYLPDINPSLKPYTKKNLLSSLHNIAIPDSDYLSRQMADILLQEFDTATDRGLQAGILARQDLKTTTINTDLRGYAVSKIGYSFGERLTFYNGMRLDQNLQDDSLYTGALWRGFSGYTEQAYIATEIGPLSFRFGRDWQRWGPGHTSSLLLSDNTKPFDLGAMSVAAGNFQFTSVVMQLDAVLIDDSTNTISLTEGTLHRRFLSAHRLDWQVSDKLRLGAAEAVLYGGENRTFEMQFLNPVIFYHGEQENAGIEGNTLVSADFSYFPAKNWHIYGEFLADDIQFDRKKVSDLEPPEIGWLLGLAKAGIWGLDQLTVRLEYSGVTNRTYNTLQPDQKYLHQNYCIGNKNGNDFDSWNCSLNYWHNPRLRYKFDFEFVRNGEASVYAPFDTSFYAVPDVSQGYSESFPTGTVEYIITPAFSVWYKIDRIFKAHGSFAYSAYNNYRHVRGKKEEDFKFRLGIEAEVGKFYK